MDLPRVRPYVRTRMELLLALLSLLTAATGAVAGARAPEASVQQAANVLAVAPSRRISPRLVVAPDAEQARATVDAPPPVSVETASAAPLYADRRRE